jgi:hypothetical protein
MKWPSRLRFLWFMTAGLIGTPVALNACTCMGPQPPCEAFGAAAAVFLGKVERLLSKPAEIKGVEPVATNSDRVSARRGASDRILISPAQTEVVFSVESAFVGVGEPQVSVFTGQGDGDCGYRFQAGQRYLVYASREPGTSHLATSSCTNTKLLAEAGKDMDFLRQLPADRTGARVEGRVVQVTSDPVGEKSQWHGFMKGIPILLQGNGLRYETITDDQGQFLIKVPEGEYEVRVELADQFDQEFAAKTIRVNDGGCARLAFTAEPGGRIRGRVRDAEGMSRARISVDLVSADPNENDRSQQGTSAWSDEEGYFDFKRLAPGRYLLGINLRMPPNAQQPYRPIYYPGETEAAQAGIISIGLGEQSAGHDLRLTTRLTAKTVEGVVVWADGRPAYGALVSLYDQEVSSFAAHQTSTDPNGRFTLEGFAHRLYRVEAFCHLDQPGKPAQKLLAEPITLRLQQNVIGLKLILTSPPQASPLP